MAAPLFLSYAWDDADDAERLDDLLRFRGVPVWRDRRAMRFGDYLEDEVRKAIAEHCWGFAINLTPAALSTDGSGFITRVELHETAKRHQRDQRFVTGAIYSGYTPSDGRDAVMESCGFDIGATLGAPIDASDTDAGRREAANSILRRYLERAAGEDSIAIRFDTRNEISWEEPEFLHLGWHPPLRHTLDDVPPEVWNEELVPALEDLRRALTTSRAPSHVVVSGIPHLSAALTLGYVFRRPGPWSLELRGLGDRAWASGERTSDAAGWTIDVRGGDTASESGALVACVHATWEIGGAVRDHLSGGEAPRATLDVRPPGEPGDSAIDPAGANGLAAAIAREIGAARGNYGTSETHLYMACPWPFAALLGHHLASVGPVVGFEANAARSAYLPACRLGDA